ncbi:MAG: hypothetical protein WAL84_14110 [Candidatus Dormiibacterota bacterium]
MRSEHADSRADGVANRHDNTRAHPDPDINTDGDTNTDGDPDTNTSPEFHVNAQPRALCRATSGIRVFLARTGGGVAAV